MTRNLFVIGPGRFVSALKRETCLPMSFPIQVDLAHAGWYTLDMHPNKKGHAEIATQILSNLSAPNKAGTASRLSPDVWLCPACRGTRLPPVPSRLQQLE